MSRIKLEKISEYEWRIPKGTKPCMNTDAIVFADETLLEKMKTDKTLEQAANVACLPGIQLYSYTMPDGHEGYGFPIGGVAGFDYESGVISPGGIGYDINCLPRGTRILTSLGYTIPIEEISYGDRVYTIDSKGCRVESGVILKLSRFERRLYKITTMSGYVIRASYDHPILTDKGMVEAMKIKNGDKIAIYPFEGVPYEKPEKYTILTGEEFEPTIRRELEKRGLIPLTLDNPKLPLLIKIYGYALGEGTIIAKTGILVLYGSKDVLRNIAEDLRRLGYKPRLYKRTRNHKNRGYGFTRTEYSLHIKAKSLINLLIKLGYSSGKKTDTIYVVPEWIIKSPLWMKRLFLATYFDANSSKPKTINGYDFYTLEIKLLKKKDLSSNALVFLRGLSKLLEEFGVRSTIRKAYETDKKIVYRLLIHSDPSNLIKMYSRIGFEYDLEKRKLALAAIVYLKLKQKITESRREARFLIKSAGSKKKPIEVINANGLVQLVNTRFIERSFYEDASEANIPDNYVTFEEFVEENTYGEIIFDEVENIEVEEYNDYVYDFTVDHDAHNFVADNIVVSNCGVRVLNTNLDVEDVRPKLKDLVTELFNNIPSGVGASGKLKLSVSELNNVLDYGVKWAVEKGFGWDEDLEYIEEHGSWREADSSKVSNRAKERGRDQLGTLGAGNHFLEIQVVDKIYNPEIAKVMGITHEGQVTVMIHTGSRGLGHQVASDYLMVMERGMRKYGISVPDRELACLPFHSPDAQDYFHAMAAAANFAWANRQVITHWVRESFKKVFNKDPEDLGLRIIYDVAHNIAKIEEHVIEGKRYKVIVHRKGATRAFPPGHPDIPSKYSGIGQPVLIPGSMGTASYILVGVREGARTFYSAPHGAGRQASRNEAIRMYNPDRIVDELSRKGIVLKAATRRVISEEAPGAYKDVDRVVFVADKVGIGRLVVRMRPIGVVKG